MQGRFVDAFWYNRHPLRWLLYPLALSYRMIVMMRRIFLVKFVQKKFTVPIIVVGNITVGGVGKTPLVVALAQRLQARGVRVGIVSRGYGAKITDFPYEVGIEDAAVTVGDEPLLIAKNTRCPVVISPKRTEAVQYLIHHHQSQVIISDDGLQHYAMGRAIEIAVIDGLRGIGNGLCLPAGPLREAVKRLQKTDFIVVNGDGAWPNAYRMDMVATQCIHLKSGQLIPTSQLPTPVAAVAGIGHPQRFFELLKALGVACHTYPFADHHAFQASDLCFTEAAVVMTEKDAVKCRPFATDSMYYLPVNASMSDGFWDAFWSHEHLQGFV